MTERKGLDTWATLELLGHRRISGYVTEEEIAGTGMLRVDLPAFNADGEPNGYSGTQYFSPQALYSLSPCTREIAYELAKAYNAPPFTTWNVRSLLDEIKQEVRTEIEMRVRDEYLAQLHEAEKRNLHPGMASAGVQYTTDEYDNDRPF